MNQSNVDANLKLIFQKFGREQLLIPLRKAAEYIGCHHETLMNAKDFPIKKVCGRYYVSAVNLARWLS